MHAAHGRFLGDIGDTAHADDGSHRFARRKQVRFIAAQPDLRIGAQQFADIFLRGEGKISVPAGKARGKQKRALLLQVVAHVVAVALHGAACGGIEKERGVGALLRKAEKLPFHADSDGRRHQIDLSAPRKVCADILSFEKKSRAFEFERVGEFKLSHDGARRRQRQAMLCGFVQFFKERIVRFLTFPAEIAQKFLAVNLH